jgi:peptidoglycan/xylan/chitin deacetylase (PgdA/CDA1 family)
MRVAASFGCETRAEPDWGEPYVPASPTELERICFDLGRSSVRLLREEPARITSIQAGTWFSASWYTRVARRLLLPMPRAATLLRRVRPRRATLRLAADVWFWAGVRAAATSREWQRLTQSSYTAFCYHEISHAPLDSKHDLVLPPERFERHLRALRLLRCRPLSCSDLYAFHNDPEAVLPRRSFLLTADDAYVDAVTVLASHREAAPVAFVVTSLAAADGDSRFAGWPQLKTAASQGVTIGSHTRSHRALPTLADGELADEIVGPLNDIASAGLASEPVLAYPFGQHDERARREAVDAGYRLAFTTRLGRNGAGTDPWLLRRPTVHGGDGTLALVWKMFTGEEPPPFLRRSRRT